MRNRRQAAANQATADAVIVKINAIGTVAYTAESKAKIDEARTAYDALTEASYDSLLTGSNTETTVENALVLSLGKNGVWFYKYSGTLGANKAYLAQ